MGRLEYIYPPKFLGSQLGFVGKKAVMKYSHVILADSHHNMLEGMRGLLEALFESVVMVTNENSLFEAAEKLKPWRYHSWQRILDPEAFLERARPILWLYEHAQLLWQIGVWVVCVDEKTSIQARQAKQAPRPAISGADPWAAWK